VGSNPAGRATYIPKPIHNKKPINILRVNNHEEYWTKRPMLVRVKNKI